MTLAAGDLAQFIRANTAVLSPPLVPELRLHLASESVPLWQRTEEELGTIGLPPPFWAFAWAGGQALARYVLDTPETVSGRDVIDLASGSGVVAIAAARAGAARVLAADIDPFATAAIAINAELNGVTLAVTGEDLLDKPAPPARTVLVGDLFYECGIAEKLIACLDAAIAAGSAVLIGDPGRSYLPKDRLEEVATYQVPVTRELEDGEIKRTSVWQLKG